MEGKKTIKDHIQAAKDEAVWKWKECKAWCRDHEDQLISIAFVTLPSAIGFAGKMVTSRKHRDEERHRNRSVYDPQHHHTYECRRDIKAREWEEIDRRKDDGESVYDILRDMRLL